VSTSLSQDHGERWTAYLDALEAGARELEASILTGGPAVLDEPARPPGAPPRGLDKRLTDVTATIDRAAAIAATVQHGLSEKLAAIPHDHGDQHDRPESLGGHLDLLG
jgi:hypothetical protein